MSNQARINTISLLTFTLLAIGFSAYYFGYVKVREAQLSESRFRVLDQMGENLIIRNKELIKTARNTAQRFNPSPLDSAALSDSLHRYTRKMVQDLNFSAMKRVEKPLPKLKLYRLEPAESGWQLSYEHFIKARVATKVDSFGNVLESEPAIYQVKFSAGWDAFVPLIRKDFFDEFIVFNDTAIIFQTLKSGLLIRQTDSLLKQSLGVAISSIKELEISGTKYKLFLQPLQFNQQNAIILSGLLRSGSYTGQALRIPTLVILTMLLIVFLIVLSLPFLKLAFMSRTERLGIKDIALTTIAVILGTAVALQILLDAYMYYGPDQQRRTAQLETLSSAINDSLMEEIDLAFLQIARYQQEDELRMDCEQMLTQGGFPCYPELYPYLSSVFWVDSTGMQIRKYTVRDRNTPNIDVSFRPYVKQVLDWENANPGQAGSSEYFYLESINSVTTGENIAILSKPSDQVILHQKKLGVGNLPIINSFPINNLPIIERASVVALSTELHAIIDPIVPKGFGFCIINEKGTVLFHADGARNLQENFLDEVNSKPLMSAIFARSARHIDAQYRGKAVDLYVHPLERLPLFLVTYREEQIYKTTNEQILTFTFLLNLLSFGFGLFRVLMFVLLSSDNSKIQKKTLLFEWLKPNPRRGHRYMLLVLMHLVVLLTLTLLRTERPLEILSLVGFSYIYAFDIAYILLNIPGHRLHGSSDSFMAMLRAYSWRVYLTLKRNPGFLASSVITLAFFNFGVMALLGYEMWGRVLLFQVIMVASGVLVGVGDVAMWYFRTKQKDGGSKEAQGHYHPYPRRIAQSTETAYLVFLLSWTALLSLFPTFTYYRLAYNQEFTLRTKHVQLRMVEQLEKRAQRISNTYHFIANGEAVGDQLKEKGIYSGFLFNTQTRPISKETFAKAGILHTREDSTYIEFSSSIRPLYNDLVVETNELKWNRSEDGSWCWSDSMAEQQHFLNLFHKSGYKISSQVPDYHPPSLLRADMAFNPKWALFWGMIFLFLAGIFRLIRFTVRRLFAFNLIEYAFQPIFDQKLLGKDQNYVFLVVPPHPRRSTFMDELLMKADAELYYLNLMEIGDDETWENLYKEVEGKSLGKRVVLDNFAYNMQDLKLSGKKLRLLEKIVGKKGQKIVLSSALNPSEIQAVYLDAIGTQNGEANALQQQLNRWQQLLSGFYKIYEPAPNTTSVNIPSEVERNANSTLRRMIQQECDQLPFLQSIKKELYTAYSRVKEEDLDEDEVILKIQSLAELHYQSLWINLSREERYVLYDLAQDGLLNYRNVQVTNTLIRKGLILQDGSLRLINQSFRNFLLSSIDPEEALRWSKENKDSATWNALRTPLMLVLVALAGFLLITQEQSFGKIIAFLTSLTAAIPVLLGVANLLGNSPFSFSFRGKGKSG
ncbi:MAG: cache domain-containing protein [Bacteroidota bacterium]